MGNPNTAPITAIPLNPETEAVARRIIWFESPEEALAGPVRFMVYAMQWAVPEDMETIRRYVSDIDFSRSAGEGPSGDHCHPFLILLEYEDGPPAGPAVAGAAAS